MCWVLSSETCKAMISLDQLVPADEIRLLVEDFKGGGDRFQEKKKLCEDGNIFDLPIKDVVQTQLPSGGIKKEPVDFENCDNVFNTDPDLSAKIKEKSAILKSKIAAFKSSGKKNLQSDNLSEDESPSKIVEVEPVSIEETNSNTSKI